MKRNHLHLARTMLIACLLSFAISLTVRAEVLKYAPLAAPQVARLSKEAKHEYDLGLAAIDKINYKLAIDHLAKAIEIEPDNVHLRFMVVQISRYMGDTRAGTESIKYYDIAAAQLKAIGESARLNGREKKRAEDSLQEVAALRASVTERDDNRQKVGREIAKKYVQEIFAKTEEEKTEEAQQKRFKATESLRQSLVSPMAGGATEPNPVLFPPASTTNVTNVPGSSLETAPVERGVPTKLEGETAPNTGVQRRFTD
ncbi:MAG: hypothetical protein M1457_08695 [bacterium]|nr:hypothetical protein [bacterium]